MQQRLQKQQLLLMRLLGQPAAQLEQLLKEEVEKNLMLEVSPDSHAESLPEENPVSEENEDEPFTDFDPRDYSYREHLEYDKNRPGTEPIYVAQQSFADSLREQLAMKELDGRQQMIAEELVGSLDSHGWLGRSIDLIANDLAFTQYIEVTPDEVEAVLRVLQSLEPAGIGARSLQECFSIQLHRAEEQDEVTKQATKLIDEHFDTFAQQDYGSIMEAMAIDELQLQKINDRLRRLNPYPGGESEAQQSQYLLPDFIITRQDDEIVVSLGGSHLPQLQPDQYYLERLQQLLAKNQRTRYEDEELRCLKDSYADAQMLFGALKQRQSTMLRVMQEIVRRQRAFLLSGDPADKQPLQQKEIAQVTGFDESTISRVVGGKVAQTEYGILPVSECFSTAVRNTEGEEVAVDEVYTALRELVGQEDKAAPLSDEALSAALKHRGYIISRRTVAKYRQLLDIPASLLRRSVKIITLLLLVASSFSTFAQQPSYFDSIINSRIQAGRSKSTPPAAGKQGSGDKGKARPALEEHEPEATPNAIDTALANADEFIDIMYDASLPPPSSLWYGRNLSGARVRLGALSMDSLPDEITIKLLKNEEKFCFPVKNVKTSPYGWRWNRPHRGVDIRLKTGDPVHAAFNGVVRIARPLGGYGNLVVIRHYNGLETVYGHLSKIKVKPMQVVRAGQVIGLGGSTGHSTGPHLHFEVRFQYEAFDPEWILDFSNYTLRTHKLYLDKTYFGIRKPRKGEDLDYKADQSIIPEEPEKVKRKPAEPVYATLKRGEKLETFAKRNNTTVERVKSLNPDIDKFKPGTKLRVR